MKIFITGDKGQLGHELHRAFGEPGTHEIIGVDLPEVDITDRDAIVGAIASVNPDIVIHAAAFTAVDACEANVELAYKVNSLGTRYIADAANRSGAHLVYVSTDYVFDGTKDSPYLEWDATNPQSVYGRSKLGGEMEIYDGAAVARTSWVCGFHGGNMVKTVMRLLLEHDTLSFVDDQRGHPTFASDLGDAIYRLAVGRYTGTFHVTNQGAVSWFEFAQEIARAAGEDPERISPISTDELDPPRPAPRPQNSVLENAALRLGGLPLLPDFRETLKPLVAALQDS